MLTMFPEKHCPCSEMDITTAFEAVILGSNPGGGTKTELRKDWLVPVFSVFVRAQRYFCTNKNRELGSASTYVRARCNHLSRLSNL